MSECARDPVSNFLEVSAPDTFAGYTSFFQSSFSTGKRICNQLVTFYDHFRSKEWKGSLLLTQAQKSKPRICYEIFLFILHPALRPAESP